VICMMEGGKQLTISRPQAKQAKINTMTRRQYRNF
jgi:hypothetical protein